LCDAGRSGTLLNKGFQHQGICGMRGVAGFIIVVCMAGSASAQTWSARTTLDQGWFRGTVHAVDRRMAIACSGSYPDADPMYGAEDGPHVPYGFTVEMAFPQIVASEAHTDRAATRDDIVLVSNGLGYQLPEVGFNMLNGERWESHISIGDQMIASLLAGDGLRVFAQGSEVVSYDADGLADGLLTVIRFCDSHWAQLGQPVPDHARAMLMALRDAAGNDAAAASMEQVALDRVTAQCEGPGQVRGDFIGRGDFDGDGTEDIVLDWRGVRCQGGSFASAQGAGQCGMHDCVVSVFVSSAIARGEAPWERLAVDARVDADTPARLVLGNSPATCSRTAQAAGCGQAYAWNRSGFVQVP